MRKRRLAHFAFAITAILLGSPAFAIDTDPPCAEGIAEPAASATSRPIRTAECTYGFDAFASRLAAMSANRFMTISVKNVREVFGIREMTSSHDAPHVADYAIKLSGNGDWKAVVWVREFRHLQDASAGVSSRIDVSVIGPHPTLGSHECIPVKLLMEAFEHAQWPELNRPIPLPPDGGTPGYVFESDDKRVAFGGRDQGCTQHIAIMQGPD